MCRHVEGLRLVEWASAPTFAGRSRARGQKARGLKFEREVEAELARRGRQPLAPEELDTAPQGPAPTFVRGPWIGFEDAAGRGLAQPDFILPDLGLVLEVKLSETPRAFEQLFSLYIPLLNVLLPRDGGWWGLQVCRNLAPVAREERPTDDWGAILEDLPAVVPPARAVWHFCPI